MILYHVEVFAPWPTQQLVHELEVEAEDEQGAIAQAEDEVMGGCFVQEDRLEFCVTEVAG